MIVKDIFSDTIPALSQKDSAHRAMYFMEFFKISHLPIVDDKTYVGMLTDDAINEKDEDVSLVDDYNLSYEHTFVSSEQHIYDVILQMSQHKLSLIAVVNAEGHYLGTISLMELISAVAKMTSLDQAGSIVILKMGLRDYSMSEIAKITEENHVKILSSYIQICKDQIHIRITLKLNSNDLSSIKASFERFNYEIVAIFSENKIIDDMRKDRLDELMYYLNM